MKWDALWDDPRAAQPSGQGVSRPEIGLQKKWYKIGQMKGREKMRLVIVAEYFRGGVTLRELETKYGIAHSTLGRWVKAEGQKVGGAWGEGRGAEEDLATEVKRLRKELRAAELQTKLLDAMIEIAEERFNIPIRKKSGPRQQ